LLYVAAGKDPLHLHALRKRFLRTPNVVVQRLALGTVCIYLSMGGAQADTARLWFDGSTRRSTRSLVQAASSVPGPSGSRWRLEIHARFACPST
jgi:hypothetical protein